MPRYQINTNNPDCGRDKNGTHHCACGKCKPLSPEAHHYCESSGGNGGNGSHGKNALSEIDRIKYLELETACLKAKAEHCEYNTKALNQWKCNAEKQHDKTLVCTAFNIVATLISVVALICNMIILHR